MQRYFYLLQAVMLLCCTGCSRNESSAAAQIPSAPMQHEYIEAERIPAEALPETDAGQGNGEPLIHYRGGTLHPVGKALEVLDAAGTVIAANGGIIRTYDESENCAASGFNRIVVKGDYFTIEQQSCGGNFFNDEYITFKAAKDGRIFLHRFSIVQTDRDDPDRSIPQRDLSVREFGQLELKDVDLAKLYEML